jgi:nucleotide-binding universal stress UspA family protein
LHTSPQFEPDSNEVGHAKNELYLLVKKAEERGVKATPVLVMDKGNEFIENYIEPYGIDLIVMGSHGVKGIREFILGSNTLHLTHHAKVPVLVVKMPINPDGFKNILFASTFRGDIQDSFGEVARLARLFKAKLHLVFVNFIDHLVSSEVAHAKMCSYTALYPDVDCTINVAETNDEIWAISRFSKQLHADLLALTTNNQTNVFKILTTRVADYLVTHENKPVLVLRT